MSEFDEAQNLAKMNVGDTRNNIERAELRSISFSDRYIHTIRFTYMDKSTEKLVLPPGEMIMSGVLDRDGMETSVSNFPIRIPLTPESEIASSTHVEPYFDMVEKKARPAKVELIKVQSNFRIYELQYIPDF